MWRHDEFTEWARLIGEVFCDFLFLAVWLILAWAVHQWIGKLFPLQGLPRYIGYVMEALLDVSILFKLMKLRFGARDGRAARW